MATSKERRSERDNSYSGDERRDDISNLELMELIKAERNAAELRTISHIDAIHDKLEQLIHSSIKEYHQENNEKIYEMLPDGHSDDHRTVKMIRDGISSFMTGLFGTLGKFVLIIILLGIGLQIVSLREIVHVQDLAHEVFDK